MCTFKKIVGAVGLALALPLLPVPAGAAPLLSDTIFIGGQQFTLIEGQQELIQTLIPGPPAANGTAVNFYEDAGLTIYSDQISIRGGLFYFTSDPYPAFNDVTVVANLQEDGTLQRVGQYFGLLPNDVLVQSDVDATPLPSSWTLMLIGLAVFGFAASGRWKAPFSRSAVA